MTCVYPDGKRHISNSELQTYKDCRRRWWLQYVRGLTPKREESTGPARLGTRVHAVLAEYYTLRFKPGAELNPLKWHDDLVLADLNEFPGREQDILKEADLSHIMLEGYFEWLEESGADEGLTIVGAEMPLEYEIMPGVVFQGKLDMRVEREVDGARMVLDHKTVMNFSDPIKLLPLDEQVRSYLLLERLVGVDGVRIDGAIWNMLRKVKRTATAKPPFYERIEVFVNDFVLRDFMSRLISEITELLAFEQRITREGLVPWPRPCRDCTWKCPFFGVCPLFDDSSKDPENLVSALYDIGDPYARYNMLIAEGIV